MPWDLLKRIIICNIQWICLKYIDWHIDKYHRLNERASKQSRRVHKLMSEYDKLFYGRE